MKEGENNYVVGLIIAGILFLLIGLPVLFGTWFTVAPGEKAIKLRLGTITGIYDNGFHFKMPYVDDVVKINTQIQKEQTTAAAASADLQNVTTVLAVNFRIDETKVGDLYTNIGEDYKTKVIDPAIQEAVKAATAKYTAEQLVTQRAKVGDDIKASLIARLTPDNMIVTEISIVNFDFSSAFNEAIEKKVTAEQNALAAKNKLEQVKYEAEQTVASAKAESEAIRLKSDAANNEKYVSLMKIEVQKTMASKWNGVLPVNMYANVPLPLLDLGK